MADALLTIRKINKHYPGVQALSNVSLDFYPGEIHALVGANGSGKSTLAGILGGAISCDSGEILFKGKPVPVSSYNTRRAESLGIALVHQEPMLIKDLNVWENIFAGHELEYGHLVRFLNSGLMQKRSREILEMLHEDIDIFMSAKDLSLHQQHVVQLARALAMNPSILIIDEFSEAFWFSEMTIFHELFAKLRNKGTCIIYISHNITELIKLSDRLTILRDGAVMLTDETVSIDSSSIVHTMLGRDIKDHYPKLPVDTGEESFRVYRLSDDFIKDAGFVLHHGEILGITGLAGSGRTRLAKLLAGAIAKKTGRFFVEGREINIEKPGDALENGIVYMSESRRKDCLFNCISTEHNISISNLNRFLRGVLLDTYKEDAVVSSISSQLGIDTLHLKEPIKYLSGGNQQKALIARSYLSNARVLIIDEPTQGVDVGGKVEIYNLFNEITRRGGSIIMLSSNISEIIGMSNRIIVMNKGRMICEFSREEATQERVFHFATNGLQSVFEHSYT